MGLRFRKSVRICKGVRLNFNKNSFGISIGGKGYGYTVNSKGRRTAHVGIPGTGLSYTASSTKRKQSPKSSSASKIVHTEIKLSLSDDGKMSFYYPNGIEITDPSMINRIKRTPAYKLEKERMQNEHNRNALYEINAYNQQNQDLINICKLSATPIHDVAFYENELNSLVLKEYVKRTFNVQMPTRDTVYKELVNESKSEIKSLAFWTLKNKRKDYVENNIAEKLDERISEWKNNKQVFEQHEVEVEKEATKRFREEYDNAKTYLNNIISGEKTCVCNDVNAWLEEIESPLEFNIDYEYDESHILWIDLDLPEIEDFPNQKAVQMANGNKKLKNKTKQEINRDYKKYVFGLAIFLSSHLFNISPKILKIVVSGYTQRRNKTGDINDDYVYSIIFEREVLMNIDFVNGDPFENCMKFKNRCNLTTTDILKPIEPFSKTEMGNIWDF